MTTLKSTGEGPALVLLHALGVNSACWAPVMPLLNDFRVITTDFPGHGSAPLLPDPMTVHSIADSLSITLRAAGVEKAHVAGMSLGGLVAQELAARHPDLVDHLVLIDTVATYPEIVRQQWRDRAGIARTLGMSPLIAPTLDAWFTADAIAANTAPVQSVRGMVSAVDPEGYARTCELLEHADTRAALDRITAPTLIVCGNDDLPAFLAAVPMFLESIIDAHVSWINPGRHAAVLQSPGEFVSALREFLPGI